MVTSLRAEGLENHGLDHTVARALRQAARLFQYATCLVGRSSGAGAATDHIRYAMKVRARFRANARRASSPSARHRSAASSARRKGPLPLPAPRRQTGGSVERFRAPRGRRSCPRERQEAP